MKICKIIEVKSCEECPNTKLDSNLFGGHIICTASDKVICSMVSDRSRIQYINKVHESCPFGKLEINDKGR
jgi:hypothetical protein